MTYTASDVPIEHHPGEVYKIYRFSAVCTVLCAVHSAHYTPDPNNDYCPGLVYSVINRKCIKYRTSCNNQQLLN